MENVQMLLPIEPKEFWHRLKMVVEEVVEQKKVHPMGHLQVTTLPRVLY